MDNSEDSSIEFKTIHFINLISHYIFTLFDFRISDPPEEKVVSYESS